MVIGREFYACLERTEERHARFFNIERDIFDADL